MCIQLNAIIIIILDPDLLTRGPNLPLIIGIVVGGVVVIMIIITAIITIIIMYLLCIKHYKRSGVPPSDYESPVETSTGLEMKSSTAYGTSIVLQMKSNSAYGQVIHTTDKPTTDGAVYETVD